ncbi:uncharacterized protein LOC123917117 isoform X3 [Trifolium pratense]|uniref:uncharacterized protein LOC123917117 isoform X3 n=1 Tax=Trifolium pratense TaxID=57577 RepID=UPI001E694057|nr:uncharacterized protein LOC123917117 isoform X3 [Trifolium pratense]
MGWLAEQLKKFRNQQWGLCTYDGICLLRFSASSRFLLSLMMKTNWESKYSRRCTGPHVKNSQKYEHLFTISCTVVALHASLQFEIQNLDRKSSSSLAEPPRRFRIDQGPLKRSLLDFTNLSISDDSGFAGLSGNVGLEINERPLKRSLLDFGNLSISDSSQNVGADSEANMTESSLTAPPLKHVFVRVKRKPFQSPLDAFRDCRSWPENSLVM